MQNLHIKFLALDISFHVGGMTCFKVLNLDTDAYLEPCKPSMMELYCKNN